jgi:Condensation domain
MSTEREARRLPATAGQRLVWLMERYKGGNGLLGVPMLYRFGGPLDRDALAAAVTDLVDRHEVLRTTFEWDGRGLVQVIHPEGTFTVEPEYTDLAGSADPETEVYQRATEFLSHDPSLRAAPVRFGLWRVADADHLLVVNAHHVITDAWSNSLIMRDLSTRYRVHAGGAVAPLPPVEWQYSEYTAWRQDHMRGGVLTEHQDHLLARLRDARFAVLREPPVRTGRTRPSADNVWFDLDPALVTDLRAVAEREDATLLEVLLSLYFLTLHRWSDAPDLSVGSIFANRARPEVAETVGFFANMLVIRSKAGHRPGPLSVLREVRSSVRTALEHEEVSHLTVPREAYEHTAGRPEDVVFHMQAVPPTAAEDRTDFGDLVVRPQRPPDGLSCRFDLELMIVSHPDAMEGYVRYACDQYRAEDVRALVADYLGAAGELVAESMDAVVTTR